MNQITKKGAELSISERVRTKLEQDGSLPISGRVLLLDVSGSMADDCGDGRSKIEALREVAREIACPETWAFSDAPYKVQSLRTLSPGGNTLLGLAIAAIRRDGARHVAIITDGLPTDPDQALRAVIGLRIDIFYVGPQPTPSFLTQLAKAAVQGSSNQVGSLVRPKELCQRVKTVLMLGTGRDKTL